MTKLVKITAGCYRTTPAGYSIFRTHAPKDLHDQWAVVYVDFFGEKKTKYFHTLAECREFVNLYN